MQDTGIYFVIIAAGLLIVGIYAKMWILVSLAIFLASFGFMALFIVPRIHKDPKTLKKGYKPKIKQPAHPMAGVFILQIGYLVWLVLGMVASNSFSWLDIATVLIALIWLLNEPGIFSGGMLTVYNLFGIFQYMARFGSVGGYLQKIFLIHISIRAAIIVFVVLGLIKIRSLRRLHGSLPGNKPVLK